MLPRSYKSHLLPIDGITIHLQTPFESSTYSPVTSPSLESVNRGQTNHHNRHRHGDVDLEHMALPSSTSDHKKKVHGQVDRIKAALREETEEDEVEEDDEEGGEAGSRESNVLLDIQVDSVQPRSPRGMLWRVAVPLRPLRSVVYVCVLLALSFLRLSLRPSHTHISPFISLSSSSSLSQQPQKNNSSNRSLWVMYPQTARRLLVPAR